MLGMFLIQNGECCQVGVFCYFFPCENTQNVTGHQKATWIPKDPQGARISLAPLAPPSITVPL